MFDLYPDINQYMDTKILSVNTNYRGAGIAGKLVNRTLERMREKNIEILSAMCSSHYSARVCEKMHFKKVYELPYIDYLVNGENPIMPVYPHKCVKILTYKV